MKIRQATRVDAGGIKNVYLEAFEQSEAKLLAKLAVNLLSDKSRHEIISLVAIENDEIVGHIAFSPVYLESLTESFATLLAPLAVLPGYQNNKVGSSLIRRGLSMVSKKKVPLVFVYGDPKYYSRFGFDTVLASPFLPPYDLQYPEGWLALQLNAGGLPEGRKIRCVEALGDAAFW